MLAEATAISRQLILHLKYNAINPLVVNCIIEKPASRKGQRMPKSRRLPAALGFALLSAFILSALLAPSGAGAVTSQFSTIEATGIGAIAIPGLENAPTTVAANTSAQSPPNHLLVFSLTFTAVAALFWAAVRWEHQLETTISDAVPLVEISPDVASDSRDDESLWAQWEDELSPLGTARDIDLFEAALIDEENAAWLPVS